MAQGRQSAYLTALNWFSVFVGVAVVIVLTGPLWRLTSPFLIDFIAWIDSSSHQSAETKVWWISVFLTCGLFAGVVVSIQTLGNIVAARALMAGIFGTGGKDD